MAECSHVADFVSWEAIDRDQRTALSHKRVLHKIWDRKTSKNLILGEKIQAVIKVEKSKVCKEQSIHNWFFEFLLLLRRALLQICMRIWNLVEMYCSNCCQRVVVLREGRSHLGSENFTDTSPMLWSPWTGVVWGIEFADKTPSATLWKVHDQPPVLMLRNASYQRNLRRDRSTAFWSQIPQAASTHILLSGRENTLAIWMLNLTRQTAKIPKSMTAKFLRINKTDGVDYRLR